jgi:hypothetical protein
LGSAQPPAAAQLQPQRWRAFVDTQQSGRCAQRDRAHEAGHCGSSVRHAARPCAAHFQPHELEKKITQQISLRRGALAKGK